MNVLCSALWGILVTSLFVQYLTTAPCFTLLILFLQHYLTLLLLMNILCFVNIISNPINVNFLLNLNKTP